MRPLVMDFREDERAQNVGDQFMFGPAFLVNPVTEPEASSRQVYLPKHRWYDFWTGKVSEGGRLVNAITPLEQMPGYVKAGSIFPLAPRKGGLRRSRQIRLNCASIRERMATSSSTKTKTTRITTRRASTQPSRCTGT